MNKKIMQIALAGFVFGACLSAKQAPSEERSQEIAMAKCSKTPKDDEGNPCSYNGKAPRKSQVSSSTKKSAAQKVVESESSGS